MPTGYTYPVAEGKVTEFPEFAMQCARAFGTLIMMRDEPMDAPIPEEFKPSDYNEKRLAESRAKLAEISTMTTEQVEATAQAAYESAKASHEKHEAEQAEADERLERMLEKVRAWTPPTAEHGPLKDFMIQQLTVSKRGTYRSTPPKMQTATKWLHEQIQKLHDDIAYAAAEQAQEVERSRSRTEWIKRLRASLAA